ncbi:MAG: alpha/beta hydrolase [Pseudomonadota bacterium]
MPQLQHASVNGVNIAYYERGQYSDDLPTLYFVHATGFHARVWDEIIEAFPEYHVIAVEQRGHGRSDDVAVEHWKTFGEDQRELALALGLSRAIGIGHSMGAHALIQGAAQSQCFSRLLLLDPTVSSPEAYAEAPVDLFGGQLHPAAKRRDVFESVDEMLAQIREKSSFPLFKPRILEDYCKHGLLPRSDGKFRLACLPEVEARVYMSARSNGDIYNHVAKIDFPVRIIRAKQPNPDNLYDFSSSPTWSDLASKFQHANDTQWPESTHFIPMQYPDRVIDLINSEVELWQTQRSG